MWFLTQEGLAQSAARAGLGLLLLNLPLYWSARRLAEWIHPAEPRERLATCWTLGWAQIAITFYLLGSFGALGLASCALASWGVWAGVRAGLGGLEEGGWLGRGGGKLPAAGLTAMVLALALGPWLRQLEQPPAMEDALTYHLSFPAEWLHSGGLRMPLQHDADLGPSYYPFAGETLLGWAMLSFGADPAATGSALLCLPALWAGFVSISRMLGRSERAGVGAWAWICANPLVVWLALVGFNDLPLATALVLALRAALLLEKDGSLAHAGLAGAALGLAVGTKYSGLALGCGVGLMVAWTLARRRAWRHAALVAGVGGLVGGYAYARNWILTGSPVYPAHLEVAGVRLATGLYSAADWAGHPHHAFDWRRHLGTLEGLARIGFCLAASLPLALLGIRGWAGAVGWIGLLAFWGTSPYRHDPRFFVPAAALIGVGLLPIMSELERRLGDWFEFVVGIMVGGAFVACGFGLSHGVEFGLAALALAARRLPWRVLAGGLALAVAWSQSAAVQGRFVGWESIYERQRGKVWSELDRLSPAAGVTVAASGTGNLYPLYGLDFRNTVLFVPRNHNAGAWAYGWGFPFASAFEAPSPEAWLQNLETLGVDYFVLGPARCEERAWIAAHPERFELRLQAGGYALYAVHS